MLTQLYDQHQSPDKIYIKITYETLSHIQKNAINDFIKNLMTQGWIIELDQYTDVIDETHVTKEMHYIIIQGKLKSKL